MEDKFKKTTLKDIKPYTDEEKKQFVRETATKLHWDERKSRQFLEKEENIPIEDSGGEYVMRETTVAINIDQKNLIRKGSYVVKIDEIELKSGDREDDNENDIMII